MSGTLFRVKRGLLVASLAVVGLALIAAVIALPRQGPVAAPASPSPSPTATSASSPTAAPSLTPSATPTASPSPSPAAGRFVNAELGYSIGVPAPWRRSDCLSGSRGSGEDLIANDVFVTVREYDEGASSTGSHHDGVTVLVRGNPRGLTPRQWYEAGQVGQSSGDVLTDVTFAGRPSLRIGDGDSETFIVPNGALMFQVSSRSLVDAAENTPQQRAAVISTFRFLSADELAAARAAPTPTPLPPRSPEQVADILAEAFAKKDVALLATVITPACVSLGVNQGGGTSMDDRRYLDELADRFREGLVVEVRPRPIKGERAGDLPTVVIESTWKDPRNPDLEQDLMISPEGERWYWRGNIAFLNGRG